ncbi:restriction endonuclease subunit S [Streptococcus suis]
MPNKERNIPKRRFKEFENADAWELRKLGELGTLKNGMNFSKDAMGTGFPFINLQNIFGKNVVDISQLGLAMASSIQLKNYNLQKGDVLFVRSSVKLEGVGEAAIVPKDLEDTTYSGFIIRYRDSFGLDNNFKRYTFGTNNIRNQIMSQATDSANKNISQQVLAELDILVPSLPEQEAIGTFFSTLDRQITLHQRKLDKLKSVKQAYLSEMFPAEGERVPKRRFPGFTDDWELRKLNNIADVRDGTHNSPRYIEFGYPLVTSKNIKNGQVNFEDIQYISSFDYEEINKRSKVNINDILMGMIGTVGNLALVREEPKFAIKNVALIKNIGVVNVEFLYHYLGSYVIERQLQNSLDGGTQKFISLNKIRHLDITFPSLPEQEVIGTFFSTLDQHITLHQRKLEKLKNLKKALLNELFV